MTHHCISSKIILAQYIAIISSLSLYVIVHVALVSYKLYKSSQFLKQHGFSLIMLQITFALLFGGGYVMLLNDFYTWFSIIVIALGWQSALLWVDLVLYAVYDEFLTFNWRIIILDGCNMEDGAQRGVEKVTRDIRRSMIIRRSIDFSL